MHNLLLLLGTLAVAGGEGPVGTSDPRQVILHASVLSVPPRFPVRLVMVESYAGPDDTVTYEQQKGFFEVSGNGTTRRCALDSPFHGFTSTRTLKKGWRFEYDIRMGYMACSDAEGIQPRNWHPFFEPGKYDLVYVADRVRSNTLVVDVRLPTEPELDALADLSDRCWANMLDIWGWGLDRACTLQESTGRWRTKKEREVALEMLDFANKHAKTVYGARARLEAARVMSTHNEVGGALKQVQLVADGTVESEKQIASYYKGMILLNAGQEQLGREVLSALMASSKTEYWTIVAREAMEGRGAEAQLFRRMQSAKW